MQGLNKIKLLFILIMCLVFSLSGCNNKTDENQVAGEEMEQSGYDIYYMEKDSYKLVKRKAVVEEENSSKLIGKLIEAMMNPEEDSNDVSVINSNVKILDYSITDNIVYINFSSSYSTQSNVSELLCRAAFVLTITQVDGIDFVGMNVNGQPLLFKNNTVSLMKAGDFADISVDSVVKNNSAEVNLYFANETGDKLKKEKVAIKFDGNATLEKKIVEALISGPQEEGYYKTLPENVSVLDAFTRNGVCYVYFDNSMSECIISVKDEIMIYSIVNSLSELTYINKVQIIVDGETEKKINDTISIIEAFSRNLDVVEEQ